MINRSKMQEPRYKTFIVIDHTKLHNKVSVCFLALLLYIFSKK